MTDNPRNPKFPREKRRTVRLSSVTEGEEHSNPYTAKWVNTFGLRLSTKTVQVVDDKPTGRPGDDPRHGTNPSCTDFLVVYTMYYAHATPPQLADAIEHNRDLPPESRALMWIAQLGPDSYQEWVQDYLRWDGAEEDADAAAGLPEARIGWHALKGSGPKNARFKIWSDPPDANGGWEDDQSRAADLLRAHHSCQLPSPACPRHQTAAPPAPPGPAKQPASLASRLRRWLGQ